VLANKQLSLFEQIQRRRPELADEEAIIVACEQLLAQAEAEPPIPVERVASLRGIVKIEQRQQPWAGVLVPSGGNFVVGVRASDGYERKRFSICHEASHTFFPGFSEAAQFRCNGERTLLEQRCDIGATELLLPRRFFLADLAGASFDLDAVEQLAKAYEASIESTTLRVASLWAGKAAVLVLRQRHKPCERGREAECEPKLRLDYAFCSGQWPFIRRYKSVDEESPFARAYAGELIDETASLGELVGEDVYPVEVHARRYGSDGRVIALVRPAHTKTPGT
jgi:hypothetical protein